MPKPRIWTVLLAVVVLLGIQLTSGIAVGIAAGARSGGDTDAMRRASALPEALAIGLVVSVLGLAFVLWSIKVLSPQPLRARIGWTTARVSLVDVALVVVGMVGIGAVTEPVARLLGVYEGSALQIASTAVARSSLSHAIVMATFGTIGGALEELFYRGYVQGRLVTRYGSRVGIVATALIFGAAHMDPLHATFAFVVGLYIGFVRLRTGSLAVGFYAHALNNAVAFTLPRFHPEPATPEAADPFVAAIGAVVFAAAVVTMHRRHPAAPVVIDDDVALRSRRLALRMMGVSVAGFVFVAAVGVASFTLLVGALAKESRALTWDEGYEIGTEAGAFGRENDDRACLDVAVTRMSACDATKTDSCVTRGQTFLGACLSVARPTDLCADAPAPADVVKVSVWSSRMCSLFGSNDARCGALAATVAHHCQRARRQ
jgi:uncharacterized protein